jgi:hypothetical protein
VTVVEKLKQSRDQIADRLVELSAQVAADTSDQGRSVQLAGLQSMYLSQLKNLDDAIQRAGGPFMVTSRGRAV